MIIEKKKLANFLIEAKKRTYAAQGDQASILPLLEDTKQLEYQEGNYTYRDIYAGMTFFVQDKKLFTSAIMHFGRWFILAGLIKKLMMKQKYLKYLHFCVNV